MDPFDVDYAYWRYPNIHGHHRWSGQTAVLSRGFRPLKRASYFANTFAASHRVTIRLERRRNSRSMSLLED